MPSAPDAPLSPAQLSKQLTAYSHMVAFSMAPLQQQKQAAHASACAQAASWAARAEELQAAAASSSAAQPNTVLTDIGAGFHVSSSLTPGTPLLFSIGCDVFLELSLREALVWARRRAAECSSEEALAEEALHQVTHDLNTATAAIEALEKLQAEALAEGK